MNDLQRITEIAIEIAQRAGSRAHSYYRKTRGEVKPDGTLVTQADREAETLTRELLNQAFPGHGIVGEEFATCAPEAEYVWHVDPVDGTSNFVFGLPLWGVSLGLARHGQPVAGVFYLPVLDDTYWGWEGGGAYLNGRRLTAPLRTEHLGTDLVSVTSTLTQTHQLALVEKLRCLGSAAHALAAVAAGQLAAAYHDQWYSFDMAAGLCLCAERGIRVTDLAGQPLPPLTALSPKQKGPTLLASAPALHASYLAALKPRCP